MVRRGESSSDPETATVVAENACSYSARCELEPGIKRRASRPSGTSTRASLFSPGLPKSRSSPAWLVYEILREKWVGTQYRAQSYRFSEGSPSSFPFRDSPSDGFAYQFAARASSPLSLLAPIWSRPAVSRANKVIYCLAQALEVCDCQMIQGSAGPRPPESHSSSQVWGFNAAYDNICR